MLPRLTQAEAPLTREVQVINEHGVQDTISIPAERPLTVYIDKRELKCACVGGDSNVPLGFISLTENLMMIAMAVDAATNIQKT